MRVCIVVLCIRQTLVYMVCRAYKVIKVAFTQQRRNACIRDCNGAIPPNWRLLKTSHRFFFFTKKGRWKWKIIGRRCITNTGQDWQTLHKNTFNRTNEITKIKNSANDRMLQIYISSGLSRERKCERGRKCKVVNIHTVCEFEYILPHQHHMVCVFFFFDGTSANDRFDNSKEFNFKTFNDMSMIKIQATTNMLRSFILFLSSLVFRLFALWRINAQGVRRASLF